MDAYAGQPQAVFGSQITFAPSFIAPHSSVWLPYNQPYSPSQHPPWPTSPYHPSPPPPHGPLTPPLTPAGNSHQVKQGHSAHSSPCTQDSSSDSRSASPSLSFGSQWDQTVSSPPASDRASTPKGQLPLHHNITHQDYALRRDRFLLVGTVPMDATDAQLKEAFKSFGDLLGIYVRFLSKNGIVILAFYDSRHCSNALGGLHTRALFPESSRPLTSKAIHRTDLQSLIGNSPFISDVEAGLLITAPSLVNAIVLHHMLTNYGEVSIFVPVDHSGMSFACEYFDSRCARSAAEALNGNTSALGVRLQVELHSIETILEQFHGGDGTPTSVLPPAPREALRLQEEAPVDGSALAPIQFGTLNQPRPESPSDKEYAPVFAEDEDGADETTLRTTSTVLHDSIAPAPSFLQFRARPRPRKNRSRSPDMLPQKSLSPACGSGAQSRRCSTGSSAFVPGETTQLERLRAALVLERKRIEEDADRNEGRGLPDEDEWEKEHTSWDKEDQVIEDRSHGFNHDLHRKFHQHPQPSHHPRHSAASGEGSSGSYAFRTDRAEDGQLVDVRFTLHIPNLPHSSHSFPGYNAAFDTKESTTAPPTPTGTSAKISLPPFRGPLPHPHAALPSNPDSFCPTAADVGDSTPKVEAKSWSSPPKDPMRPPFVHSPVAVAPHSYVEEVIEHADGTEGAAAAPNSDLVYSSSKRNTSSAGYQGAGGKRTHPTRRDSNPPHHRGLRHNPDLRTSAHMSRDSRHQHASSGGHSPAVTHVHPNINTLREPTSPRNTVDIPKIESGMDTRSTVMIKNIPSRMTHEDLYEFITKDCPRSFDFLYLRMDFVTGNNVGYAFVNFMEIHSLVKFLKLNLGKRWNMYQSEKIMHAAYATYQGKSALVTKFQNSSILDREDAVQPHLYFSTGPNRGLPENFPPPSDSARKARSQAAAAEHGLYSQLHGRNIHAAVYASNHRAPTSNNHYAHPPNHSPHFASPIDSSSYPGGVASARVTNRSTSASFDSTYGHGRGRGSFRGANSLNHRGRGRGAGRRRPSHGPIHSATVVEERGSSCTQTDDDDELLPCSRDASAQDNGAAPS